MIAGIRVPCTGTLDRDLFVVSRIMVPLSKASESVTVRGVRPMCKGLTDFGGQPSRRAGFSPLPVTSDKTILPVCPQA